MPRDAGDAPTASPAPPPEATATSSPTAASVVFQRLRHDILQGALAPDARLRVADISARYACGTIPTREALNRLAAEALVVYSEQRGFAVAPISEADLADLTRARSWMSELALREAIRHGDAAWEERVLLGYHRLSKVPRYLSVNPPVPNPAYDRPHREFHDALLSGCGSRWMVELCARLFDHAERYRNLSRKIVQAPREDEHKSIVDAALARHEDEAVALIKRHVEFTTEIVLSAATRPRKRAASAKSAHGEKPAEPKRRHA